MHDDDVVFFASVERTEQTKEKIMDVSPVRQASCRWRAVRTLAIYRWVLIRWTT